MDKCVVVTGAGRSGTSMTTGLLERAGLRLSSSLIEASEQNPKGAFEDAEILMLQRKMLARLGPSKIPPPDGWLSDPDVLETERILRAHIAAAIAEDPKTLWGFKDPNTAFTLRLWSRIFEVEGITPRIVLCLREPSAVIASMARHYQTDPAISEVFWLTKYISAIRDTEADLFIAHYERLIERDDAHLSALLSYCGFEAVADHPGASGFIDPDLNRSGGSAEVCSNPLVARLWAALQSISGAEFDRDALLAEVGAIEADLNAARGWLHQIHHGHAQSVRRIEAQADQITALRERQTLLKAKVEERAVERDAAVERADAMKNSLDQSAATIDRLETDRVELIRNHEARLAEQDRLLAQQTEMQQELRGQVQALRREIRSIKEMHRRKVMALSTKLETTRRSASFQVGHILMRGLRQPGRNTLAVPVRLARLIRDRRKHRRSG